MRKQTILAVAAGVALGLASRALFVTSQEAERPKAPRDAAAEAQSAIVLAPIFS